MKCDRCNFDEATHEVDEQIRRHFPQYEHLCDYDFHILHRYIEIIEKVKANE